MKILLFTIIFFFRFTIYAQDIYVIKNIKGNVVKSKNSLKKGDTISGSDKISFSEDSGILLISEKNIQIAFATNGKTIHSKKVYTLDSLFPQSKRMIEKAQKVLNDAFDFQNHFGTTFRVYGNNYAVRVASLYNVMYTNEKSDRFFFFQMSHSSEKEPFNKHLQGVKNHLNFRKNEIFALNGKSIQPKDVKFLGLYFYNKLTSDSTKLADFQMEFVDDTPLLKSAKTLIEIVEQSKLNINSYELFCNQIKDIADHIYGKTDKDGLEYWIENKLHIYRPLK